MAGTFKGTVDFDPGPGNVSYVSNGSEDIFFLKLDASGNLMWAKKIGGTGEDFMNSICVDSVGNIYSTGHFKQNLDFDPGTGTANQYPSGYYCQFVAKYTALGDFVWVKKIAGAATSFIQPYHIQIDNSGNIYTTGKYGGDIDFDPGLGIYPIASPDFQTSFTSKLDPLGNFVWAMGFPGSIQQPVGISTGITLNGDVYCMGYYNHFMDADPSPASYIVHAQTSFDVYLVRFTQTEHPVAEFSCSDSIVSTGDTIQFTDHQIGYASSWFWDFGDGATSTLQHPQHIYQTPGSYDVKFIVSDAITSNTRILDDLIIVDNLTYTELISPEFSWATDNNGTSSGASEGKTIITDSDGNVYCAGVFSGTIDFDPGPGVFEFTSLGDDDIYISKQDEAGNFTWAKQIGAVGDQICTAMKMDGLGNLFFTGHYEYNVDFDPGVGVDILSGNFSSNIFILKLDSSGNYIWAKPLSGNGTHYGYDLCLDDSANIFLTGSFYLAMDTDPNPPQSNNLYSNGGYDIFICKFDSSGAYQWAQNYGHTNSFVSMDAGNSIQVDSMGYIYITGKFEHTVDFDFGPADYFLTSVGNSDLFILKLDIQGNFVWAKSLEGSSTNRATSIEVDNQGNVIVSGGYGQTCDFNPDTTEVYELTSIGQHDAFVLKLNSFGDYIWAASMGGSSADGINISLDNTGNIYGTGFFTYTADFYPGLGTYPFTSNGYLDCFVLKLDSLGNLAWVKSFGGSAYDRGNSIHVNNAGSVFVTGSFASNVDFDPGPGVFTLSTSGYEKAFVLALDVPFKAYLAANQTNITLGDTLQFSDKSTGNPTSWFWDFGDGTTDVNQNPTHYYSSGGTYTVSLIASDNMHSDTIVRQDYIHVGMTLSVNVIVKASCFGTSSGAIDLAILNGTPPYSFTWSNGASTEDLNNIPPGTYSVDIIDQLNVTYSNSYIVSEADPLNVQATITHVQNPGIPDGAIVVNPSGGTPPYNYQWSTGDTGNSLTNIPAGNYNLSITDANMCDWDSSFVVLETVNIHSLTGQDELVLYQNLPNPFGTQTTFGFYLPCTTLIELAIYNSIGEKLVEVFKGDLDAGKHKITFDNKILPDGIYLFRLETKDDNRTGKMIIVRR